MLKPGLEGPFLEDILKPELGLPVLKELPVITDPYSIFFCLELAMLSFLSSPLCLLTLHQDESYHSKAKYGNRCTDYFDRIG